MKISEAFPSKYLNAADLDGQRVTATIRQVQSEEMRTPEGLKPRPVVHFQGRRKSLVLNKTNAQVLVKAFGDETDTWRDKEITLFAESVSFQGKIVDGIRVRAELAPVSDHGDDEIPF
jgi:hypothetical protein